MQFGLAAYDLADPYTSVTGRNANYLDLYLAFKALELVVRRLGKAEVAKKIGVELRKLDYMIRDGEFPPGAKIGKPVEWLEEVVDAWLELTFAPQREWIHRAATAKQFSGADDAPALALAIPTVQPIASESASPPSRVITTTLHAAGVPTPVRLV